MSLSPMAREFVASPNFEPRRGGRAVDMLVMHYTGIRSARAALDLLVSPDSKVSCHYLIDEDGTIVQMVGEDLRAWHAGASIWLGETDTNSRSVGIEIHNPGHGLGYPDFPLVQMKAVVALSRDIFARHDIPPANVLAHSDIAPGRKIDPGEKFDWRMLHEEGVGRWIAPSPRNDTPLATDELTELQRLLAGYGYGVPLTGEACVQTTKVIDAFQRHFRAALVTGIADRSTLDTARRLTARA